MHKEFIVCSAVWINDGKVHNQQPSNIKSGFVICGLRHNNCYQAIKSVTTLGTNEAISDLISTMTDDEIRDHQGFLTSFDRYVTRKEAWSIAKDNNQIVYGLEASENGYESILISENLY